MEQANATIEQTEVQASELDTVIETLRIAGEKTAAQIVRTTPAARMISGYRAVA